MSREKTRLFCPGTSDLNGTGKGLIGMCLWGKRVLTIMKARTSADMDRNQANSKKILLFLSEDNLATTQ